MVIQLARAHVFVARARRQRGLQDLQHLIPTTLACLQTRISI